MARARIIGLTLLALAVPTFAFGGEQGSGSEQSLSVSASLGGCGLAQTQITCQIDTSWNAIEGAEYYTVSVTRPDGSVLDLGQTTGTGRTVFVSYVGPGGYSVQVAAWGTPPGEDEPEVLARERASSTTQDAGSRTAAGADRAGDTPGDAAADETGAEDAAGEDPAAEQPGTEPDDCADPADDPAEEPVPGDSPEAAAEAAAPAPAAAPAETAAAEGYDPADADGDRGCPLDTVP